MKLWSEEAVLGTPRREPNVGRKRRTVSPPSVSFNRLVARNSIYLLSVVSSLLCLYGERRSSLLCLLWRTSVVRRAGLTWLCIEV